MIATKMLSILTLDRGGNVTLLHITSDDVRNDMLGWMRDNASRQSNQSGNIAKKRLGLKRIWAGYWRVNLSRESRVRNTNEAKCHSVRRARQTSEERGWRAFADSLFGSLSGFPWLFAGEGQESRGPLTVRPTNKT